MGFCSVVVGDSGLNASDSENAGGGFGLERKGYEAPKQPNHIEPGRGGRCLSSLAHVPCVNGICDPVEYWLGN
jgi:hypothetical protein